MNHYVHLAEFRKTDDMQTFAAAMDYLREHPGTTLTIAPGTYLLTSEMARSAQSSVMNGEWGSNPQRHMFNPRYEFTRGIDMNGIHNCRIHGFGVTLMVEGFMEPISMRNCEDVELSGITIDHVRKPYTRGVVTSELSVNADDMHTCIIQLDDPITAHSPFTLRYIFYDPKKDKNIDCSIRNWELKDPTTVSAQLHSRETNLEGLEFYTVHTYHSRPAILIENARRIKLDRVTIHSSPGMGIVGNRSEHVFIRRLNVIPSPGHAMSTNTDATHFTSMKGTLRLENCVFEGQGDDFTNIHGYYHAIIHRDAGNICVMQEKTPDGTHAQTLDYPDVGDTLELVSHDTLKLADTFTVVACEPDPENWCCRVTLDHDLPENTDGLMLADVTRLPMVEIEGCTASRHFARSVLVKTRSAIIEDNHFRDVQGPAIVAAAESWWYEGVCPANIIIRKNRIVNCAANWGEAAGIVVKADSNHPEGQSIRNIVIEDNIIDSRYADHGIYLRNIDGVKLARNRICTKNEDIVIEDCINIEK